MTDGRVLHHWANAELERLKCKVTVCLTIKKRRCRVLRRWGKLKGCSVW